MQCPKCKKEIKDTASHCPWCGFRLNPNAWRIKNYDTTVEPDQEKDFGERPVKERLRNDRYEFKKVLGEGAMGIVYLYNDTKMEEDVVVKVVHAHLLHSSKKEYIKKGFIQESKILFKLKHGNLPKVIDYFIEDDLLYFIMDYIEGKNLSDYIKEKQGAKPDLKKIEEWLIKMLKILHYLHNQEPPLIHRDIKPSNIIIRNDGEIFLVDFGLAKRLKGEDTDGTKVGTLGYSPPDSFSGEYGTYSDIFSLGATFHYLISRESPQERKMYDFPTLNKYCPNIPPNLEKIIAKMTQQNVEDRYKDVDEVLQDLQNTSETKPKSRRKERMATLGCTIAITLLNILVLFAFIIFQDARNTASFHYVGKGPPLTNITATHTPQSPTPSSSPQINKKGVPLRQTRNYVAISIPEDIKADKVILYRKGEEKPVISLKKKDFGKVLRLNEGKYSVVYMRDGYYPKIKRISPLPGATVQLSKVHLSEWKKKTSIFLTVNADSMVKIFNAKSGKIEKLLEISRNRAKEIFLDPGNYTIMILKPGYRNETLRVSLKDGERIAKDVEIHARRAAASATRRAYPPPATCITPGAVE